MFGDATLDLVLGKTLVCIDRQPAAQFINIEGVPSGGEQLAIKHVERRHLMDGCITAVQSCFKLFRRNRTVSDDLCTQWTGTASDSARPYVPFKTTQINGTLFFRALDFSLLLVQVFVHFNRERAVGNGKRRLRLHSPRTAAGTMDTQAAHTGLARETAVTLGSALMRNASLFFVSMVEANSLDRLGLLLHFWEWDEIALGR
jgi:hypothetical protein